MLTKTGEILRKYGYTTGFPSISPSKGFLKVHDISGNRTRYISCGKTNYFDWNSVISLSNTSSGFVYGTGNTQPTEDDEDLDSRITSGLSASSASMQTSEDMTNKKISAYWDIALTNTSNAEITIKEIGRVCGFNSASEYGGEITSQTNARCIVLLARSVLDNPITIPAGEARTIRISYEIDFSEYVEEEQ